MPDTSSPSFETQGLPRYPYTIIRTFLCGHPPEHIEVNIDPDGNKQHILLSIHKLNISRWIDHGDTQKFDLKFSLQRCRKCAEEHEEKRQNTHKKDVRSLEASKGEVMREWNQRGDGFEDVLQRRRYGYFYRKDQVPYHDRLDENDYGKQDRTVKGPGGQSYERAVRGTEEELVILERIARFEKKKEQEEREERARQEQEELREQQERRELRKQREQEELQEEREREQLYQQQLQEQQQQHQHQKARTSREQVMGHVQERPGSRATLRSSGGPERTSGLVTRNSAGTAKSTGREEGKESKGWRGVLSKTFPRRTSEGSRRDSAESRLRITTPVSGSFVRVGGASMAHTSGYDDEERERGSSGIDPRCGVLSAWENKEGQESRGLAARYSGAVATKTSEGAAASSSEETGRDSLEGERERYEAQRAFYDA